MRGQLLFIRDGRLRWHLPWEAGERLFPSSSFQLSLNLYFIFKDLLRANLGKGGQRISEREKHQGGKENMDGIRDVKLCLVYNLGEWAFLTCH